MTKADAGPGKQQGKQQGKRPGNRPEEMSRKHPVKWLLAAFALLGLAASVAAAFVHYQLLTIPDYQSICDINATWSCASAYLSQYGSYLGIPVAVLGALFFTAVSLLLVADHRGSQSAMSVVVLLSSVGLAFVLYLGYATFFLLKTICIICLITYVAAIGLFVVANVIMRLPMRTLPQFVRHDLRGLARNPIALGLTLLFLAGATTAIAYFPREAATVSAQEGGATQAQAVQRELAPEERAQVERAFDAMPRSIVPVAAAGAKVVIVKFNDFQCPACANAHNMYKPLLERWEQEAPGQVKLFVKDFPLEPECNTSVKRDVHAAACEAAAAVRLARQQQKDVALEEWFYGNQGAMTPETVRTAARDVGGVQQFDTRYQSALEGVKTDVALASTLGVSATPTIFINGVKLDGLPPPNVLDAVIAYELRKASSQ
ncbi:MAG: thioredoxin domain-containing protein [Luteitalea sp.]|nr:thioredoxin domain-containing protein [Luteitalea sp.]